MTCYDMFMTVVTCVLLTVAVFGFNVFVYIGATTLPYYLMRLFMHRALRYLVLACVNFYLGLFIYGVLTVASEWKRIQVSTWDKIKYLIVFPLFIATYIPISIAALKGHVEWTPIEHYSSAELAMSGAHRRG